MKVSHADDDYLKLKTDPLEKYLCVFQYKPIAKKQQNARLASHIKYKILYNLQIDRKRMYMIYIESAY